MNKKSLAKLLIKHPEIKALYESQEFDASTINKIIAEEIIREDDDEGEGRVSKDAKQTRAAINSDNEKNLDAIPRESEDIEDLKQEIADAQSRADLEELAGEVDPKNPKHRGLIKALKDAKKRIAGESTDTSEEDSAKKQLIQSMKSEIEFLKTLLNDPNEMPLDKEEYKQTIDEYIQKLEAMGVKVVKTDSIEDDKEFIKSVADSKPAIEKAADVVKTAGEDDFTEKFSDLDDAIMASLQKSKDAAETANNELDLSDIEVDDNNTRSDSSQDQDTKDPIDKALDWVESDEAASLFVDPVGNANEIDYTLRSLGLDMSPFSPINTTDISGKSKEDVAAVLKRTKGSADEDVLNQEPATEEGTAAAVEAIQDEVPESIEDIQPADVEVAKEKLEPEIEADSKKQANAKELKNKVEKNTMPKEQKLKALEGVSQIATAFKKANADIEKRIEASKNGSEEGMAELPKPEEILSGPINAMLKTEQAILDAPSWEDLESAGIWPQAIKTRREASQLPDFTEWKKENSKAMSDKFGELRDSLGKVDISGENAIDELVDVMGDAAITVGNAIQNSDSSAEESNAGDSDGSAGEASTDLETIEKILPELKDKFPNLFKFQGFVKNLGQALMGGSSDASGADGDGVDADGTANSSDTNIDSNNTDITEPNADDDSGEEMPNPNLQESLSGIYLTEETDVTDTEVNDQQNNTSGKPLDVADAATLKAELDELRKILEPKKINVEDLLPQDLKDALAKAPETDVEGEAKTAEQAAEDGNQAGVSDAQKEQAEVEEIYARLIQPMDNFFSTEQAERLGFMEQFLLESQSKMLWNLIGDLTIIAEKGKAKAFTKRKEKEEAGMSGVAAPEAEVEQTADPEVQAEAVGDFFKRDKEPVEISKEDQISLKTDLKALLQTLRATKSMIKSYEGNMTKVSVDPGLDGSALKEQLDQYLPMVQKSIAKIVERANEAFIKATELNAPKEKPEVSQPADDSSPTSGEGEPSTTQESMINAIFEAMQPAFDGMYLMEEDSRDETINFVDGIYNEMRAIYASVGGGEDSTGLRGFLETGDRARSIQQAEKMLELATKEDFTKLFPGGRIGEGGMPATVNAATETMNREIKKLVLIMRDVVTLASKSVIPHSKLVEIVNSLTTISKSLYNSFGAKMMISGESLAQIETRLGEDEGNKSLTNQETKPGMMDKLGDLAGKAGELGGKALDKLKQMFSWMSVETRKLLLKFFGEDSELIDGLSNSDLSDDDKQKIVEEVEVAIGFLQNLKDAEEQAVNKLFIDMGKRGAQLAEEVFKYTNVRDFEKQLSSKFDPKLKEILFISMNKALSDEERDLVVGIMRNKQDEFVSFMTTFFKIKEKLGDEAANEVLNPKKATITQGDQDPNAEDEDNSNIDLPKRTQADQQSDPSDIDPDADPFGDATSDQEPEDKPESRKIGLKDSLKKVSPRLRQEFISSKDVKADNLSVTTKFLAIAVVNSVLTDAVDPNLGAEVDLDENKDRSLFVSQVLNKMKNKEMVEKIKTFMINVSKGQKTYVNLFNLYSKAIKPPESSYTKLAQYIDALTEKAKEVKKEGFLYKNAGNLTALNSDLATEKPKSFNLEESLRPIIEKMLKEHYNH